LTNQNKNRVEARLDPAFLSLKKNDETMAEFVTRAMTALRDGGNKIEHGILIKMCGIFIKKRIQMDMTQDEVDYLTKIIKDELK